MKQLIKLNIHRFFPSDWGMMKWVIIAEVLLLAGYLAYLLEAVL